MFTAGATGDFQTPSSVNGCCFPLAKRVPGVASGTLIIEPRVVVLSGLISFSFGSLAAKNLSIAAPLVRTMDPLFLAQRWHEGSWRAGQRPVLLDRQHHGAAGSLAVEIHLVSVHFVGAH